MEEGREGRNNGVNGKGGGESEREGVKKGNEAGREERVKRKEGRRETRQCLFYFRECSAARSGFASAFFVASSLELNRTTISHVTPGSR